MSYQSLYREWRPTTFSEVYGQEHIKQTLGNMLEQKRIPHAFLFCGPRGTGKTTMAKIFAKAANCAEGISRTPCLKCKNCLGVANNNSIDVVEIDAASNRGIDEIRQLREQVKFAPTESRYKVYIIDEVHMLTTEAFNALLKTLEEPPAHVLFVLATTEPHKLPLTIISRCQRFDFQRLSAALIQARLKEIAQAKEVNVSGAASLAIAQLAEGGMRDALGMLEQCLAYGEGSVDIDVVHKVTGSVPLDVFLRVLSFMVAGDEVAVLKTLDEELNSGREANQLLSSYLSALRMVLLASSSPKILTDAGHEPATVKRIADVATSLRQVLPQFIDLALKVEGDMKYGGHPRLHLELLLIKQYNELIVIEQEPVLTRPRTHVETKQKAEPTPAVSQDQDIERPAPQVESSTVKPEEPQQEVQDKGGSEVNRLLKAWPSVIKAIRAKAPLTASTLGVVVPQRIEGNTVVLKMSESNPHTYKRLQGDLDNIRAGLSAVLRQDVNVKLVMNGSDEKQTEPEIDLVKETLDLFKGRIVE